MTSVRSRRHLLALAALLLPAAASAAAPPSHALTPGGAWNAALMAGVDLPTFDGASTGPRVAGELLYGLGELAPRLTLDLGPRAAYTYNGSDANLYELELLATGRLSYALSERLALYGDVGLGIGYAHAGAQSRAGSVTYFSALLAPGGLYALSRSVSLLFEVGLWINADTDLGTHVAPTLGLQWKL